MSEKTPERPEARTFLQQNPEGLDGNRFDRDGMAAAFVEKLYQAGATRVLVDGLHDRGQRASTLVVELRSEPAARHALFRLYNAEVEQYGEDFGADPSGDEPLEDTGQSSLHFGWD